MTELYRGLLLILTGRTFSTIEQFRKHIQSFKSETSINDSEHFFDLHVLGFWNLVLEIIFTLFSILGLLTGIVLLITLAIVAYPFEALFTFCSKFVGYTRNPLPDDDEPKGPAAPVIVIKKNDKEKK